jgi:hypothetical protein
MPKYAKIENGIVTNIILAEADFAAAQGLIETTDDAEIGGTYADGAFARKVVVRTFTEEKIRDERNARLRLSDWTQVSDAPLTDAERSAWATYRQELRDVTAQEGFPNAVIWPVAP